MVTISAEEAREQWATLLDRVALGERITISRQGVPVAVLSQPEHGSREERLKAIERIRQFAAQHKLGDLSIREMIEDGRR